MKKVFNLIIVDESGSMSVIREQAFSGMNETLSTIRSMQKKYPDTEQHVTLITFDSDHMKWHYDDVLADHTHELSWRAYSPCAATPLYDAIGKNAIEAADRIRAALDEKGYVQPQRNATNQIFIAFDRQRAEALSQKVEMGFWENLPDGRVVMRVATSWATRREDVDKLIELL